MTVSRLLTMRNTAGALLALLAFGVAWPSARKPDASTRTALHRGAGPPTWICWPWPAPCRCRSTRLDPPAPVPPCAGMRCSNDPAPAPPAAPAVAPAAEQWGYLADLASGPDITSSPLPCDDPAVRPRHRGVSPFHPLADGPAAAPRGLCRSVPVDRPVAAVRR